MMRAGGSQGACVAAVLSIQRKQLIVIKHFLQPSVALCFRLFVSSVYCGKMADADGMSDGPGMRQALGLGIGPWKG